MRRLAFVLFLAPACSWSSFDELADQTWVDSAGDAEGVEPNDFLGVAAPGTTERNAVFAVLGHSTDSVGSYAFDTDGARSTIGVEIRGGTTQFGPLDVAVVAGDPYSNVIGVGAISGANNDGDTKLVHFAADNVETILAQNDFNQPTGGSLDGALVVTGMAYAKTSDDAGATTDVVLARANEIAMVQDYVSDGHTIIACRPEAGGSLLVPSVAAGDFDGDTTDDELVAVTNDESGASPEILIFEGATLQQAWIDNGSNALAGCWNEPARAPLARIAGIASDADYGKRMVVGDFDGDGLNDIVVSSPASNKAWLYQNDGAIGDGLTAAMLDAPSDASGFGATLAVGDLDGDGADELLIGAPNTDVDGKTNAGAAYVYRWNGSALANELTLHDAQPEDEQRMGLSVAAVPWGPSAHVLVVGGMAEVFTYFRLDPLYDDVRQ
jgi:hypothetical protein